MARPVRFTTSKRRGHANPSATLEAQLLAMGFEGFEKEHRFHDTRQWRLDFAWPEQKVAVEVEGKIYGRRCGNVCADGKPCRNVIASGRHARGQGMAEDMVKYNELALYGWTLIRVHRDSIDDGTALGFIERALDGKGKVAGSQRGLDLDQRPGF